jgi:hypothetical protein
MSVLGSGFLILLAVIGRLLEARFRGVEARLGELGVSDKHLGDKIDTVIEKLSNLDDRVSKIEGFILRQ